MNEIEAVNIDASIDLNRDVFFRDVLRHLTGTLQDVVGLDDASGFVSVVGQRIGDELNEQYKSALQLEKLDREQVTQVLISLKHKISGNFVVVSQTDEKIILQSTSCPFGDKVKGRPSLCMMTSNVFGVIAAENLGYAKVQLSETIAKGSDGCKVVIYLQQNQESNDASGIDYFQG
ncbi:MAG: methanogen output domain 1-containing protein [Alishewanella sp.]|nr:methanogen output domain 1-containing protein [Alishewanella sp.]